MDDIEYGYDTFISYSHADSDWVKGWLLPRLEQAGLRVCIDVRDFDIGVPSLVNMERAVDHSRHTLLVLTPAWVNSEWTEFEQLLTQTSDPAARRRRLLPLLLRPCQPPPRIAMLTYADFTQETNREAELQRVLKALKGELSLPEVGSRLTQRVPADSPEARKRQAMLTKVRQFWIEGVLDQSLYRMARIELGLEEQPEAVERPWEMLVQLPDQAPRPLPPSSQMSAVFDELQQALLILGAPGAGKTTLLLELARELLDRAEQHPAHPMPVVFHLSSWAAWIEAPKARPGRWIRKRAPLHGLEGWLVDELNKRYDVPRKMGQAWIEAEQVLPLLDGLDEVAAEHRESCVEAINGFRQQHGLLPLAVCSRRADYEALKGRLRLPGAIFIQPLSQPQVGQYLKQAGRALAGVRAALKEDTTLWELLDTPLMLSIITLAYRGCSAVEVRTAGSLEERRVRLFAAYTEAMFKRRGKEEPFTQTRTLRWLAWLASAMKRHDQTQFYLEWMQPDWLPTWGQRLTVTLGAIVVSGLVAGLPFGLVFGLRKGLLVGLDAGLLFGLSTGGFTYLQHYILRLLLWHNDFAPLNYVRFLDYAAERVFLRKVGSGYIFVHRLLMDYFASLHESSQKDRGGSLSSARTKPGRGPSAVGTPLGAA
jgi:DNA polymerase III delta prime subunit